MRLVVYRIEGRSIWPVFNEKVLAGLGANLKKTGKLSPGGRLEALSALRRFRAILESYDDIEIHAVATAAIRESADGADFVKEIEQATDLKVRVLSGKEEAYFSTEGVRFAHNDVTGIVGDLGGASLELKGLPSVTDAPGISLNLGPFSLGAPTPFDAPTLTKRIHSLLEPHKRQYRHNLFHAVGGAWRTMALLWMKKNNHPIEIVQQYEISAKTALEMTRFLASQSALSLEKMAGVAKKRVDNLGYAALVMQCLIEVIGYERIQFSAYGLREGLLFDTLSPEIQALDPLIAGMHVLGTHAGMSENLGRALGSWIVRFYETSSLTEMPPERLVRSAAELSDMGARLHPDHRADLVFDQVLRAPVPGQNHWERAFLAACLYTRYCGSSLGRETALVTKILSSEGLNQATELGLLLRLGCDLSAKSPVLLAHSHIELKNKTLVLTARPSWEDLLLAEQTKKRARALAQHMELNLKFGAE